MPDGTPLGTDDRERLASVTLDDKFSQSEGVAFMTGTQALLRITMDTLRWSSEHRENWERSYKPTDYTSSKLRKFSHGRRTMIDENFRAPTMFAQVLRETIMKHPEALGYTLHANEYRDLCHFVTDFN